MKKINMGELIDFLVGMYLVDITNEKIVVEDSRDVQYTFTYECVDDGCTCTYADIESNIVMDISQKPLISKIEICGSHDPKKSGSFLKMTIFGEYRPTYDHREIANVEYCAGSSGWRYGSTVTIVCEKLKLREVIVKY